jgi:hypothetical protein
MPQGMPISDYNATIPAEIAQFEAWKQKVGEALAGLGQAPTFQSGGIGNGGVFSLMPQDDTVTLPGGNPYLLAPTDVRTDPAEIAKSILFSHDWNKAYSGQPAPASAVIPPSPPVSSTAAPPQGLPTMLASAIPAASQGQVPLPNAQPSIPPATAPTGPLGTVLQVPLPGAGGQPASQGTPPQGMSPFAGPAINPLSVLLEAQRRLGGRR